MILAAIDIGTNTLLLLIAEVDAEGVIHPIEHQQRIPRLGKDVGRTGAIGAASFDRIAWIVNEYKNLALQYKAEHIFACATSAVRDASNREEFISFISRTTGVNVLLLSGKEEALLTYKGAMSGLAVEGHCVVLDIGGGSTEMSFPPPGSHNGDARLEMYSMQIGAVRIKERFFRHDPPLAPEIEAARALIVEELAQIRNPGFHDSSLVGVAGTVTTLACLEQGLPSFDVGKVAGYFIPSARVEYWSARLSVTPAKEILALSEATEGRADILSAGALVLNEIIRHFRFPGVIVSERGLRFGLIRQGWERLSLPGKRG